MSIYRKRIRYSLRTLLLSVTIFAVLLGIREQVRSAHIAAIAELEANGAQLFDRLIDPIGPNWMWTWNRDQSFFAPGYLSLWIGVWFEQSPLCTEIRASCIIHGNAEFDNQIDHLSSLLYLATLDLRDADITVAHVRKIAKLRNLSALFIVSDAIDEEIIRELMKLRQLQSLVIEGTNIPDDAQVSLASTMPSCSITVRRTEILQ